MAKLERTWGNLEPAEGRGWGERYGITRALEARYLRWGPRYRGGTPGVAIAHRNADGELVGVKFRRPDTESWGRADRKDKDNQKYLAAWGSKSAREVFLLEEARRFPGAALLLVGGEKDALVAASHLDPERWAPVSGCTGEGSIGWIPPLLDAVGPDREFVVAFDGDKAGRDAAKKAIAKLHRLGVNEPKDARLPEGADVTDLILAVGPANLAARLEAAQPHPRDHGQNSRNRNEVLIVNPLDSWREIDGQVVHVTDTRDGPVGKVKLAGVARIVDSELVWSEDPELGWTCRQRSSFAAKLKNGRTKRHTGEGFEGFTQLLELCAGSVPAVNPAEQRTLYQWVQRRSPKEREVREAAGYCGEGLGWLFPGGVQVVGGKVRESTVEVRPPGLADLERYHLKPLEPSRLEEVAAFVVNRLIPCDFADRAYTLPILAAVLVGPIWTHAQEVANWQRYTFFVQGPSGVGKSQLTRYLMAFWGDFARPGLATWGSTAVSFEDLFYRVQGAPVFAGDWKEQNLGKGKDQAIRTLQLYGDRTVRGRARQDGSQRARKPPRCQLLIDGEQLPEGEQSTLGRMVILRVRGHMDQRGMCCRAEESNLPAELVADLPGLTAHWIAWVQRNDERLSAWVREIEAELEEATPRGDGQTNRRRVLRNHTLQLVTLRGFFCFLDEECGQFTRHHYQRAVEVVHGQAADQVQAVAKQSAGEIFLATLQAALLSGDVHLDPVHDRDSYEGESSGDYPWPKPKHSSTRVGFYHLDEVYLWPKSAVPQVRRRAPDLLFGQRAIAQQLLQDGTISNDPRQIRGQRGRWWALRVEALTDDCHELEGGEDAADLEAVEGVA